MFDVSEMNLNVIPIPVVDILLSVLVKNICDFASFNLHSKMTSFDLFLNNLHS